MATHINQGIDTQQGAAVFAALMTAKGTGAISTIQLFGNSSRQALEQIFTPVGNKTPQYKPGQIILGTICDGQKTIDQVTIGCEEENNFAIHCHGNPLIVDMIIQLLKQCKVQIISPEQMLLKIMQKNKAGIIAMEATIATVKAKTLTGSKIIAHQKNAGLSARLQYWHENINHIPLDDIKSESASIIHRSLTAKLIIYGCSAVLLGPANSGKSTLFNLLSGKKGSIVNDSIGTTRDWISANCKIGDLAVELIDTAGLEKNLSAGGEGIDQFAQYKALEMLQQADLILLVFDSSRDIEEINSRFLEAAKGKKCITILNKSDLPIQLQPEKLGELSAASIQISAKTGSGIAQLREKILQVTGIAGFELQSVVCFTDRQYYLLEQLLYCESTQQASAIITELLTGRLCV